MVQNSRTPTAAQLAQLSAPVAQEGVLLTGGLGPAFWVSPLPFDGTFAGQERA